MSNKGLTFLVVLVFLGLFTLSLPRLVFPDKEEPVSEPQIVYYPDNFAITSYTPVLVGSAGDFVSASVSASISSNSSAFLNYQWYVYTPVYSYWRASSFSGCDSDTLSFQLNSTRADYLFCCVVSSSLYDYVIVSPPISCRLVENNRKADSIVLDYYEPWELDDLSEDVKKLYFEKLNSESGDKYESSTVETTMYIKKDDSYIEETIPTEIERSTESEGE